MGPPGGTNACCGSVSANVYGTWGNTVTSGTRTWYSDSSGTVGEQASGTYTNYRTGTTGTYQAGRSVNPYTGIAQQGYQRTFDTPGGTSGSVERGDRYNAATGTYSYGSSLSATGPGGSQVTRDTAAAAGPEGTAAARQTTIDNTRSGETSTFGSAHVGNNYYASAGGNVYRNTGSGWEQHTSSGWQSAGDDDAWANREQQARTAAEDRFSGFQGGGWADRFQGGAWGDRFAAGG